MISLNMIQVVGNARCTPARETFQKSRVGVILASAQEADPRDLPLRQRVTLPKGPSSFQTRVDTLLQPFLHATLSSDTDFCILSILHGRPSQQVHHLFSDFDASLQPRFFYPPTS